MYVFMKKIRPYLEIGNRLKECRKNFTQKEFADKIGIPLVTYQKYDSGERMPPGRILSRVAEICGKTVDYLLGRDLASVIAEKRTEYETEKAELASLSELFFEKLVSSLGAAYTREERELMIKLMMVLRGENKDNRKAIIEIVNAFYKTRDVCIPNELKKTNHAG